MTVSHQEQLLEYWQAAVEKRKPEFVPCKVLLHKMVRGDFPFHSTFVEAGEYECESNQWGAVSVTATNGAKLGIKPSEFVVIELRENK